MMRDTLKNALIDSLLSTRKFMKEVKEGFKEQAQKMEEDRTEQQPQADMLAEQQRIYNIIYYLSDAVVSVLKPGSYDYVLEDIYEEKQFENNGYFWTEPVVVETIRRAHVYAKPLLDVQYSDVFRVAIFGNISEENMIALTDYFRRVPGYKYKKVGVVVSGLAKELVFCATNNVEDFDLINTKLASRDETRTPYR